MKKNLGIKIAKFTLVATSVAAAFALALKFKKDGDLLDSFENEEDEENEDFGDIDSLDNINSDTTTREYVSINITKDNDQ